MIDQNPSNHCALPCALQEVQALIASKWTIKIVYTLQEGPLRFSELERQVRGISQKMLTQTLRKLEADSLVRRTVHPVIPVKVDYALTPAGHALLSPLKRLCEWVQDHLQQIHQEESLSSHLQE